MLVFSFFKLLANLKNVIIECRLAVLFPEVGGSTLDSHHGFVVEYGKDKDVDLGNFLLEPFMIFLVFSIFVLCMRIIEDSVWMMCLSAHVSYKFCFEQGCHSHVSVPGIHSIPTRHPSCPNC